MQTIKHIKLINCPGYPYPKSSVKVNAPMLPPLGLAMITSYLRSKGIEVSQDDLNIKIHYDNYYTKNKLDLKILLDKNRIRDYVAGENDNELTKFIDDLLDKSNFDNVDMVGLSISWEDNITVFMSCLLLSKHIKERYKVPIVIGGPACDCMKNYFLELFKFLYELEFANFYIRGRGEMVLYELINRLNNNTDLSQIKGLVYIKDGIIIDNGYGDFKMDIKPDFKGLPLHMYISHIDDKFRDKLCLNKEYETSLILPIQFILGCPHRCIFCGDSLNDKVFVLEPHQALNYLKDLSTEYNTKLFYFLVDTLNISCQYIADLCDELIKSKINILWSTNAHLCNLNQELIQKIRDAGCIRLIFGLETASPRLSKYIRKGLILPEVSNVLRLCHKANIWVGIEIIAGLPTENEADIDKTVQFLRKNIEYIDTVFVNPFRLVDGSLIKTFPEQYGITNIREISQFRGTESESYNLVVQIFSYDEVNGLAWTEKKKQISHSFNKIINNIPFPYKKVSFIYDEESLLFYLYANYKEKNKVRNIYYAYFYYVYYVLFSKKRIFSYFNIKCIKKLIIGLAKSKSKFTYIKEVFYKLYLHYYYNSLFPPYFINLK